MWAVSSQTRLFASDKPSDSIKGLCGAKNDILSFCIGYRANGSPAENGRDIDLPISISVEASGIPVKVYKIINSPYPAFICEDADRTTLGGCPDALMERAACPVIEVNKRDKNLPFSEKNERALLCASCYMTQGLYVELGDGNSLPVGTTDAIIRATSLKTGEIISELTVSVEIFDAMLPKNRLIYTNWFHYDCLSDVWGIPVWCDGYFERLRAHIHMAVEGGMTMLFTPAFTPALDTPVGKERDDVALVKAYERDGEFYFDLSLLRRFMILALDEGIEYFEHCHLFSQWGAGFAINIYGERNGERVKLFDWDTPACDVRYTKFLRSYLTAFLGLADELGVRDRIIFHISDEPHAEHLDSYRAAVGSVSDVISGCIIGDALSNYDFYKAGICAFPIVRTTHAPDFDGKCDNMMLYYTSGEIPAGMSNRVLHNSPWKTRILGLQLYRYGAKGFLHWGYNYYYARMSQGLFNPQADPSYYKNLSGSTFLIYYDIDGSPMSSLREKQMRDAINDHRALMLLESLVGRDEVLALCERVFGGKIDIFTLPYGGEQMLLLRDKINNAIRKALNV